MAFFCVLNVKAQKYLISFAGTGASTTVNTVKVENLTKGTFTTLNGSDILHLTILTGINLNENERSSELKIYPNPMTNNSILEIFPPAAGDAIITICDMTGKSITQINSYFEKSRQQFRISGLNSGLYLINVNGRTYHYSGKLLCNFKTSGMIHLEKISNNLPVNEKTLKKEMKGEQLATIDMDYSTGDRLKFTGTSGIYSTVISDIPSSSKTITFDFIECTDGENNNYPVVAIGTQIWMAENLKTTKYNTGADIPLVTDDIQWSNLTTPGYCWYNNDATTYKNLYGAMYNWYTVNMGNLCPDGWHVPYDSEWTILENYLINNGFTCEGTISSDKIAKSLASSTIWTSSTNTGAVGNTDYPAKRNATGFTALPGGFRIFTGSFFYAGFHGDWWSATEYDATFAWYRYLSSYAYEVVREYYSKTSGLSVRCLKN